jgi:hypothetical protein
VHVRLFRRALCRRISLRNFTALPFYRGCSSDASAGFSFNEDAEGITRVPNRSGEPPQNLWLSGEH